MYSVVTRGKAKQNVIIAGCTLHERDEARRQLRYDSIFGAVIKEAEMLGEIGQLPGAASVLSPAPAVVDGNFIEQPDGSVGFKQEYLDHMNNFKPQPLESISEKEEPVTDTTDASASAASSTFVITRQLGGTAAKDMAVPRPYDPEEDEDLVFLDLDLEEEEDAVDAEDDYVVV
ncbi:hypothetical protein PG997_015298 [Apiospora hydei]|uniref:Uncharacterized protein n=1 Tax=Apiospora hydei TaxID=1337664 RepID=A0ABR1UQ87_9PEZI